MSKSICSSLHSNFLHIVLDRLMCNSAQHYLYTITLVSLVDLM
jgi:hypothetical protein